MQTNSVDQAGRQQLRDEVLALIRSRAAARTPAGRPADEGPAATKPVEALAPAAPVQTERAVQAINESLKVLSTSLRFEIDDRSGRTLVKVVDGDSGEVLRQIPSEAALQIARSLDKLTGHLVNQAI